MRAMAHNDGFCMVCNEVQAPEVDHISGAHRLIHGRSMRLRNPLSAAGCHELCISFRVCVIGLHSRVLGFCWRYCRFAGLIHVCLCCEASRRE